VREWPIPHIKKQLRSFLGFNSYYRKFVKFSSLPNSSLTKSLYALTENKSKFIWEDECQSTLSELKHVLSSSLVLSFPREFILDIDASNIGIGAVLLQRQEGKKKVIAYYSRVLNKTGKKLLCNSSEL